MGECLRFFLAYLLFSSQSWMIVETLTESKFSVTCSPPARRETERNFPDELGRVVDRAEAALEEHSELLVVLDSELTGQGSFEIDGLLAACCIQLSSVVANVVCLSLLGKHNRQLQVVVGAVVRSPQGPHAIVLNEGMVDTHTTVTGKDATLQILLINPSRHGHLVFSDLIRVYLILAELFNLSLVETFVESFLESLLEVDRVFFCTKGRILAQWAIALRERPLHE